MARALTWPRTMTWQVGDYAVISSDSTRVRMNEFWHGKRVRITSLHPGTGHNFDYNVRLIDNDKYEIAVYARELDPIENGLDIMLRTSFGDKNA